MALHLVGESIDKARAHHQAEAGKLQQLMRGIYVDADDNIDEMVLKHAVRIAFYLYSNAYLSGISASSLSPTADGRLFITSRRSQRTRIRSLEIIQNKAPSAPSLSSAIIEDGIGEFVANVSSIRQRFLEAFRMRSEHATSIDSSTREAVAARLVAEYGSPKDAADAVWVLARQNEWYKEGEQAERFLLRNLALPLVRNEAAFNLIVAWHAQPIGNLMHDGFEWRWQPNTSGAPLLVRQTAPGKLPPFIVSILPEGWLASVLHHPDARTALRSGKRYMSNITIVENQYDLVTLPADVLTTRLNPYQARGLFTGTYKGPGRDAIEQDFERNLAQIYEYNDTPRLSGIQIKAPMFLDVDGTLSPSIGRPFTHILKPAGTTGFEFLPVIEWLSVELGRTVGFSAPQNVLIIMPDEMPPALLIERFDIRTDIGDKRLLAMEDMCSVLDLPPEAKYEGTIEKIANAVRPLSTAPEEDLLLLLKRALFAWLIADGDMHLKNIALLKIAQPENRQFSSVRIAPLYDAVTTRVFPRLGHDRMALKINGKDNKLHRADFLKLANTVGIRTKNAESAIEEILSNLTKAINQIRLPDLLKHRAAADAMAANMLEICHSQIKSFS
ncbi:MAG: HipA-like [Solimicrobium sp.]|jgi:serine/threonine-protein kinase HipA|nr:HipA-like [Solimicrobium sp.]